MNVFQLRQQVIQQYERYTKSFLNIQDDAIRAYIDEELARGKLWPDALIQLSPAYDQAGSVADLAASGVLHSRCADVFTTGEGPHHQPLKLYRHQRQAIDLARNHQHYVVTTGTGSGKSLTYMLPIVDAVLRNRPQQHSVRAIIVYPMNALINSQEKALERFLGEDPVQRPVRFARYTGQESASAKEEILNDPPHILLTNYVMLEYMLTRPDEARFVDRGAAALDFIVLDELHTYRGRQGADVALLIRRLRERCGNPDLRCIGTSATMASGGNREQQRAAVAGVASTIFGVDIPPANVIEETLVRSVPRFAVPTDTALAAIVHAPLPDTLDWETFQRNPLVAWIEDTFGLDEHEESLRRATPRDLASGAAELARRTHENPARCVEVIRLYIQLGSQVRDPENKPGFAFKLHQFISQGSAVYATLNAPEDRKLTIAGQHVIKVDGEERLLYPLVFCRECGQHYYLCTYRPKDKRLDPRPPLARSVENSDDARAGYLLVGEGLWDEDRTQFELPDSWYTTPKKAQPEIKKEYAAFAPQHLFARIDGNVSALPLDGTTESRFMATPFLNWLNCGVVYTKRERDFGKLAGLSSEGRSTATTLISVAAIDEMRRSTLPRSAQKLLSFTDNRQDASLQAGHFNDFASVAMLRAAIYQALTDAPEQMLDYTSIARHVFETLDLDQAAYIEHDEIATYGGARRRNEDALTRLLEYRIYEDLRRSWRITQPNLEQCGLLSIDYLDLSEVAHDDAEWGDHTLLREAGSSQRERLLRALLDHMRRELAVNAPCLDPERQPELKKIVNAKLNDQWRFSDDETAGELREASCFYLPGDEAPARGVSLAPRGTLGRFLRSAAAWPQLANGGSTTTMVIGEDAYGELLAAILRPLLGANLITNIGTKDTPAYQLRHDALLWRVGDGTPRRDLVRARYRRGATSEGRPINLFFRDFYKDAARNLRGIEGREHTGQVRQEQREQREQEFREGKLPVLFCSPTMELGIDIADLNTVHMRNVPPTPANYAQRSGRAGRSGQPAFVVTYCSNGSGHDQYFFQRPQDMVAGEVAAPQMDLANEDLLRAHMHAVWLRFAQLERLHAMTDLIDIARAGLPLHEHIRERISFDAASLVACHVACQHVLDACQEHLQDAPWFRSDWLDSCLDNAAVSFDRACERWRGLFLGAVRERDAARQLIDDGRRSADKAIDREEAKRRAAEAERQLDLLCNTSSKRQGDSDFYPYRYLASEGFLPGYNFPRLPVRAFLRTDTDGTYLTRPRFLALTEFAPQNVIYHEGRKYRVTRAALPPGGAMLTKAKVCNTCGYFHPNTTVDLCEQCGTPLSKDGGELLTSLFEMTTAGTQRIERITCEEEERLREGYDITTHYRFASGARRQDAMAHDPSDLPGDAPLLKLSYSPAATIWRVNHGWRRVRQKGFALDLQKGLWGRGPAEDGQEQEGDGLDTPSKATVRLMVHDTRNLLVVEPPAQLAPEAIITLQYALQRAIEEVFQLEEQELSSELLTRDQPGRILYWEAAEGGAGVLRRLVEEPDALARVARQALLICHYNPESGAELVAGEAGAPGDCARACYRCLLSYGNQMVHSKIDRRLVRDLLRDLLQAQVAIAVPVAATPALDTLPFAVQRVFDTIMTNGGRAPDAFNHPDTGDRPLLVYDRFCLLCPEQGEDVAALHDTLEDAGYVPIVIAPDADPLVVLGERRFWKAD